jgi:hypothetical protein
VTPDKWLEYIGIGSVVAVLTVNIADAAAHAFEKYALTTPETDDDVKAKKMLAAIGAVRELLDAVVGLLRPFKK